MMWLLWNLFDLAGTLSFAVSGAIVGTVKHMDIFGISVLAVLTAVGGGMIRDVLAGRIPPAALRDPTALILAVVTAVMLAFYVSSYRMRGMRKRVMSILYVVADTIGLASFTVTGTMVGLSRGEPESYLYPVVLGLLTAVGGGILRDLMAQRIPVVLVADVYATASIFGSIVICLVWKSGAMDLAPFTGALAVIILRVLAIRNKWQLYRPLSGENRRHHMNRK
jgi:uncharacterized membrane protein YeiH